MGGPAWLPDGFAAIMLVTAVYCLGRLLFARLWERSMHYDVNIAHVAMGVAMAGMLVGRLQSLPTGVWEGVFGVLAVWFLGRTVRFVAVRGVWGWDGDGVHHVSHYSTHLVMAAAMLFMFLDGMSSIAHAPGSKAIAGGMSASGMAGNSASAGATLLPMVFVLALVVSAVWHADGMTRFAVRRPGSGNVARRGIKGGPGALTVAPTRPQLAPRLESVGHIVMCVTMAYMLVLVR
jgi:hypothetical protein